MENVQFPLELKFLNKFVFKLYGYRFIYIFIYTIQTEDFYKDIRNDIYNDFDTSDYPQNNIYNIPLVNNRIAK